MCLPAGIIFNCLLYMKVDHKFDIVNGNVFNGSAVLLEP